MKAFKSLLVFTLLLLFGSTSFADEQPLTKELVDRLGKVMADPNKLEEKYPDLADKIGLETLSKGSEALASALKQSEAYDDIKKTAKENGFSSIEELTGYMFRLWSARAAVEMAQMPHGLNDEQLQQMLVMSKQILAQQKESMIKAGKSETEVNAEFEKQSKELEDSMKAIQHANMAAKNAKPADVEFVKANIAYIEKMMDI